MKVARQPLVISDAILNGASIDIVINDGIIQQIAPHGTPLSIPDAQIVNATGCAVFPTFANLHTHAAMTLLRGYGNDVPLHEWLNHWIWPKERLLTDDHIYWGVRLACIEMIRSGTTAFADMYFGLPAAARAVRDSGLRALLGDTVFGDAERFANPSEFEPPAWQDDKVRYGLAPHAIYTVSDLGLQRVARYCQVNGLLCQLHMSETEQEVSDCLRQHGCRPYEHLEQIGVLEMLDHHLIGAHSLHLSPQEIALMARHGVVAAHNPNSNLKLGSGFRFLYSELRNAGVHVTLGTDGCSSSNNLDMLEAAKMMSLLQKGWRNDPMVMPAKETLQVASLNGFEALGVNAGELAVGKQADMMLVNLEQVAMIPDTDMNANLLYAAHSDVIDTVICGGNILMRHRQVEGEKEVAAAVRDCVKALHITGEQNEK